MKLIVGLGNFGEKYERTFHNVGFMTADEVASILGVEFSKTEHKGLVASKIINGEKIFVVKPQTYMNLSGECVHALASYYKIPNEDIIVIYDDFDLPKGTIRLREKGSAGTHNGMRNIVNLVGADIKRIRVGIFERLKGDIIDYVLSEIKNADQEIFDFSIKQAAQAAVAFATGTPFDKVMLKFNGAKFVPVNKEDA